MMEVVAALAALKMPVVLFIYMGAGTWTQGGPAMHPMPSMAACESVARRIEADQRKMSGPRHFFWSCQDIRP